MRLMMPGGSVRPTARSSSSMLLLRDQSPASLMNAWPRSCCRRRLGTRFIVGTASVSRGRRIRRPTPRPRWPCRGCDDTPPPLNVAATVMPFTAMRPSLVWPPRALKNVIVGVTYAVVVHREAGRGVEQRADGARRRNGRDRVGGEHGFAPHALHVDHRRFTGDGDGLLETAHAQLDRNGHRGGAAQHDAFALDGAEAGKRDGQRVGAGQVDEPVPEPSVTAVLTFQ